MAGGDVPPRRKDGTHAAAPMPARGTRPPFEKGNLLSLKSGAYSDRVIADRAEQVRELLDQVVPDLAQPLFDEAIVRYCRAEARSQLLHEYVMAKADADGVESVPAYLWTELARSESNAAKFGADCGLEAAGLARISRDLGLAKNTRRFAPQDGPQLGERGRAIRIAQGHYPVKEDK